MAIGTMDINSLLAVEHQSAAEFGLDTIALVLQADIDAHNMIVTEMLADLCELSDDRQRIYGSSQDGDFEEVDEFGRARSEATLPGSEAAFPLRKFVRALGWTSSWLKVQTPNDMARLVQGAEKAHLRRIQTELKRSLFRAANYTYNDHLIDKFPLPVKRVVNADGANIPEGPNGEVFDPDTHTHFAANAAVDNAELLTLIDNVVEHGHGTAVKLYINRAQESAIKAFADFTAYPDPRLIIMSSDKPGTRLDITRLDNRAIGIFGAAEVWVKPWIPPSYYLAFDADSPQKTLVYRQRPQASMQGLQIVSENDDYPLLAQIMEAEYGLGCWTRTNGAMLYGGGGAWVDAL